jgi:hypothetical protein
MTSSPKVSVVVAVYNAEAFLIEALESVLAQSFDDLELVVVDDGSSDSSAELLRQIRDPRMRLLTNSRNIGFAGSLNRGFDAAQGSYIARLDADDVCVRDRLRQQVDYLDAHQSVAILGTAARVVGEGLVGAVVWSVPESPLAVRFAALLRSPFLHPSGMIRRTAFKPGELVYDARFAPAEDYELWSRALRSANGANLSQPLITYRLHGAQMTSVRRTGMLNAHDSIARSVIAHELPRHQLTLEQVTNLRRAFVGGGDAPVDRTSAVRLYLDLFEAFAAAHEDNPELGRLRQTAATNATRVLLSGQRDAAFFATMRDIIKFDPTAPFLTLKTRSQRMFGRWRRPTLT